jgi:tetratricopeptide (TPR) repeat protein
MTNAQVGASRDNIRTTAASDDSALRFGWAAIDAQRPNEAEHVACAVLSRHPQHLGALHLLGLALLIQKRPREAVGPLTEAARNTTDPLLETHYALALRDVGRNDEAIIWLERAIGRRPVFAPAFHELGLIFCGLRRYDEAEAVLKQGTELAPSVSDLWVELGGVYICKVDPANAKVALARALVLTPGYVRALHGFGTALLLEGDYERAADQFRDVLAHRSDHLRARLDLAHCLLEVGQFEAGVAELRTIVRAAPRCYGNALKMLASSRRGRLWLRPSVAASFLQTTDFLNSTNERADHGDLG